MPSRSSPTPDTNVASAEVVRHHHSQRVRRPLLPKHDSQTLAGASDSDDSEQRPAKRRKVITIRKRQSTLDLYTTSSSSPAGGQSELADADVAARPPNKVTVAQPAGGGQLPKTVNGTRHALNVRQDELGLPTPQRKAPTPQPLPKPALADKKEEKRTLRSQDEGPRLKSELAVYFPNYEDIVFDAPKEEEFITVDTVFYITDDGVKAIGEQVSPDKSSKGVKGSPAHRKTGSANGTTSPSALQRTTSNQLNGCARLNFDSIAKGLPHEPQDPLDDEHYLKSHRRAERKEKQLRNIEKERAMHEKVQLDRLLDGLLGHDWLKVLGITGITDGEAKKYEPKRQYFIAEVQALVDKFRQWKEQEKKLKLRKEREAAAAEESGEEKEEEEEDDAKAGASPGEFSSSDLNEIASSQLLQETASAMKRQSSGFKIKLSSTKNKNRDSQAAMLPPPPPPDEPITSFYAKRHLREAALSNKTRHGRHATAFGHPIPELDEREFELPEDYVNADVLRANARERRRRKRASVMDANG